MFLPIHDQNPLKVIPFQRVTVSIIVVCTLVFLGSLTLSDATMANVASAFGTIPAVVLDRAVLPTDIFQIPAELTLITAMFLHGGIMHLIGNMLFLWVFGDNVEDAMGHYRFLIFYLLCGVIATACHVIFHPNSTTPLIGASGGVAGILGAYVVLHPRVKIWVLAFNRIPVRLRAGWVIGAWALIQVIMALGVGGNDISWSAHIGGFMAGALLVVPFRYKHIPLFDRGVPH